VILRLYNSLVPDLRQDDYVFSVNVRILVALNWFQDPKTHPIQTVDPDLFQDDDMFSVNERILVTLNWFQGP